MTILIKYYNRKMLLTIDLNTAIEVVMKSYENVGSIRLEPMTERERAEASEETDLFITAVRERFWIFEIGTDGILNRQKKLESETVHRGEK